MLIESEACSLDICLPCRCARRRGYSPSPAIGHYLDRYDNEVNSLKKTARNNLPKNEYYRDIMFTIVSRLEAKGFQVRLPTNLSKKYRYFVQQKNTEFSS